MASKVRVTKVARLSFPSLFEAKPNDDGGEPKFEATCIFPASTDLSDLETAIDEAAQAAWGDKKKVMLDKMKYFPIKANTACTDREGERRAGYEEDEGKHAKFKSSRRPKVVGREKDPATGQLLDLSKEEIYAGCWVRVSYTAYAGVHDKQGPYVMLIMQNVQLVKEGESLSGVVSKPEDDFADDDVMAAALAD